VTPDEHVPLAMMLEKVPYVVIRSIYLFLISLSALKISRDLRLGMSLLHRVLVEYSGYVKFISSDTNVNLPVGATHTIHPLLFGLAILLVYKRYGYPFCRVVVKFST
jgi:hypothetical protein